MRRFANAVLMIMMFFSLSACMLTQETRPAPVSEVDMIDTIPKKGIHHVHRGETLYAIAWRYGLDYRYLAERNHIAPPYHLSVGQTIYLKSTVKPVKSHAVSVTQQHKRKMVEVSRELSQSLPLTAWRWPARGPIIAGYSSVNKGIDIGGQMGATVVATAAGRVVYSGNGLRGYGNLIIIKHNARYLSAYAHNSRISVKEGQWVKAGQKIAEMGNSGARRVMVHFEIRQGGKPVNPLVYLKG